MKNPERHISVAKSREKRLAPPPEIVANVQGSSAGAGSGEFHVYKASRRREYERLKMMDEELKKEKEKDEFETKIDTWKENDDAKTAKNRAKREKKKMRTRDKRERENTGTPQSEDARPNNNNNGVSDKSNGINLDGAVADVEEEAIGIKIVKNAGIADKGSNGTSTASHDRNKKTDAQFKGVVIFDDD